ncbi:MAG: hypothetical protein JXR37_05660 [Kiritimatiellae bacterium]|nr:hypothetical protein [Kiritimatiellia bacterium]
MRIHKLADALPQARRGEPPDRECPAVLTSIRMGGVESTSTVCSFVLATLLVALPYACLAAPSINGVTGTLSHGAGVTIAGSGFGAKSPAAPVAWDDLEDGACNTTATVGMWNSVNHLSIGSTQNRHPRSAHHAHLDFGGAGAKQGNGYFTGPNDRLAERWFAQYWFLLAANFDWGTSTYGGGDENLANVKIFRMWNPGSANENFVMATEGWGSSVIYTTEYVSGPGGGWFWAGYRDDMTKGAWHNLQFEFAESSLDVTNGRIRVWFDGREILNNGAIKTREDYAVFKRPFILGFYDSWNDANTDSDDFYIDDAYIDNSWARIEIGDRAAYADCTHREIQIPTAWAAGSITITVNQGSFTNGQTVYLYVVDAAGAVNPSGFPACIGGSIPDPPPSPPTGLRIF